MKPTDMTLRCRTAILLAVAPSAARAQFNGTDFGTGAKFSLIDPANSQRHAVQDYFASGSTQFGFRNQNAEFSYNLQSTNGSSAGFAALRAGMTTVYDQRARLVLKTTSGTLTTDAEQSPIYPKSIVSTDYYRDYYLRPIKFGGTTNAIGEFRYHAYADRVFELSAVSYSGTNFAEVQAAYLECPVAFASYQVYSGSSLTPTDATNITHGAVIIQRPNGTLLGFTFPPVANNLRVEFAVAGTNLLVRHYANLAAVTGSIKPTPLLEWGRRVFASASYAADAIAVLAQMQEELNPFPADAFSVVKVSGNEIFNSQEVQPMAYDPLVGVYRFRSGGVPWGAAITDRRNKYPGGRVTITPPSSRLIYVQHQSDSPDTAAVLQDATGYPLPVRLGIARSLGGDGVPDWTGLFENRDPFTSTNEATRAWGRAQFPVRLQVGARLTFNVLNIVHCWGYKQIAATGSVIAQEPLATSNRGVWSAIDPAPWRPGCGDFRGYSSPCTGYAWGIPGPGREEQFAHALEMLYPSVGLRPAQFEDQFAEVNASSHFIHHSRHSFERGKVEVLQTFTELTETNEHRLLSDVEFIVNENLTLGTDERLNVFRLMPNRILFYNTFQRSTAANTLAVAEAIGISADINTPSAIVRTRLLEGDKPSVALNDKRWTGDPNNANPSSMSGVEGNFFIRVMSKNITLNG